MSTSVPTMRLVDSESSAPATSASSKFVRPARSVDRQVDCLQSEIDSLQSELQLLRQRDHTLNFCMQSLDEELRLAARLQQDFLPRRLPQVGPVNFHTLYRPAGYVSGDLYDVMRLDETHVGFYLADAIGHGMPAALLTMFLKHSLVTKEVADRGYRLLNPSQSLGRLNEALISQNLSYATFATAFYGMVDTQTMRLTFARAGHPLPILLRSGEAARTLDSSGGLLGIFPEETYNDGQAQLQRGDRIFVFTDGMELAFGSQTGEGGRNWPEELDRRRSLDTPQLLAELNQSLDTHSADPRPKDDVTMIVVEVS